MAVGRSREVITGSRAEVLPTMRATPLPPRATLVCMYGYQPPKRDAKDSWAEVFMITKAVLQTIALPLAMIGGAMALLIGTLVALFSYPPLALLPLGALGAGLTYLVRRDRRAQADLEAEINRRH